MAKYRILSIFLFLASIFFSSNLRSQMKLEANETIDFKSIKSVLKNDKLDKHAQEEMERKLKIEQEKEQKKVATFNVPGEDEFWGFFTEYWLVKNAPILKWDFKKLDYGLEESFQSLLQSLGYIEKKFKILLVDTPNVYHLGMPSNPDEFIYLVSLPFIRTLDLSKLQISLLLLEDYFRIRSQYFQKYVTIEKMDKFLGSNFYNSKIDLTILQQVSQKYDEIVFDKGFNFQQQFEITRQMGEVLKSNLKLWQVYLDMLKKIDELVKSNVLYEKYNRIYPSPELQINWLMPKEGVL